MQKFKKIMCHSWVHDFDSFKMEVYIDVNQIVSIQEDPHFSRTYINLTHGSYTVSGNVEQVKRLLEI